MNATSADRTPRDASEFEREQLQFLMSGMDVGGTLAELNPSLSWLPILYHMNLVDNANRLVPWIERNFDSEQAVRDIVENLRFFRSETANLIEFALNKRVDELPSLLVQCWRLIIQDMRSRRNRPTFHGWFEIAPLIRRGDISNDVLQRLSDILRPKLKLEKARNWYRDKDEAPERPSDLMQIDFEVSDAIDAKEVVEAWPRNTSTEIDARLIRQLTAALSAALEEAVDAGVESDTGFSLSDADVPSVARHDQNTYRSGFYPVVRVIADIWDRLATKSSATAAAIASEWKVGNSRLLRRLSLYASANSAVPPHFGAQCLIELPSLELFITGASVEVHRLIYARWRDFEMDDHVRILRRISEGPARELFRESEETDRHIDRCRFDLLGEMRRRELDIGSDGNATLNGILSRWPQWELRSPEQAGFHMWHESGYGGSSDQPSFADVPDSELVAAVRERGRSASPFDSDIWNSLCQSEPDRAFRGLQSATVADDWDSKLWRHFLWSRAQYATLETEGAIASLVLQMPVSVFAEIVGPISSWLEEHVKTLPPNDLWGLWDRIADTVLVVKEEVSND